MNEPVGVEGGVFLEGIPHGRFDIGIAPGNDPQNEMPAGPSLDLIPDPVKEVRIMGAEIRFCLAVGEKTDRTGRGAAGGKEQEGHSGRKEDVARCLHQKAPWSGVVRSPVGGVGGLPV